MDKWINATESSKVDFSDCLPGSFTLQGPNLGPGVVGWIVLEHLQTSKTTHHQSNNSTQYLVSIVPPIIVAASDNHLLVEVSSSESIHRPGKTLLCTEQHFWRCICTEIIMWILMVIVCRIVLQLDDGFNNYHKYCQYLYNSGNIIVQKWLKL